MSKRLIDANELISAMYYYEHNEGGLTAYDAQDIINKAPTIEPKRGEWKRRIVDNGFNADWVCSECGYRIKTDFVDYNFCPNCGADMRKKTVDYKHVVLTCDAEGNWSMHGEHKESE